MRNFTLGCLVGVVFGALLAKFPLTHQTVARDTLTETIPSEHTNELDSWSSAPIADKERNKLTLDDLKVPSKGEILTQCPAGQIYSLLRNRCDTPENVNRDMADIAAQVPGLEEEFKTK